MLPGRTNQDLYLADDFSYVKGKHTIKVGGLYSRNYKAEQGNGELALFEAPSADGFKGLANQTGLVPLTWNANMALAGAKARVCLSKKRVV
jgi:hypothetical protein